jgi:Signal transduction histidine kinase
MKKWNISLTVKITGLVLLAFIAVLGNEVRLGIDRYIKSSLEAGADSTILSLDKFSKAYMETIAIDKVDLTSSQFMELYQNALDGDNSKIKCLTDKNGKIIDISREETTSPVLCMIVNSHNEEQPWPAYLDLSKFDEFDLEILEHTLIDSQDDTSYISVDLVVDDKKSINANADLSWMNDIAYLKINSEVVYEGDENKETIRLEGTVSSYTSQDVGIVFVPRIENSSLSSQDSLQEKQNSTVVLDYTDSMESLKQQIEKNFQEFKNSAKSIKADFGWADYYLIPPYEYNNKYYSTVMMKVKDWSLLTPLSQENSKMTSEELEESMTIGYIFVTQEYDHLILKSFQQYMLDNSSTYVLTFALIICICATIAYTTVKPIRKIEKAAKYIARKEFDYPVDTSRRDEIGDLSRSIDKMKSELKNTIYNLNQEIERVQKMELVRKEFVSNFTHEIKTPLGIINGFSELVEIEQDEKKRNEYIDIIQGETKRINELVLAMLDLSKLESQNISLTLEEVDMLDIVDECLDSMMYLIEKKNIHLETDLNESIVIADQFRMEMLIQNFITNAIRYTLDGKSIYIHLDAQGFEIENETEALPDDELEKIWLTFHKVADKSRSNEGTGLGLAICRTILELHHFEYGVKNTERGVLFFFKYQ